MKQQGISTTVSVATLGEFVTRLTDRAGDRPPDFGVVGQLGDATQAAAVRRVAETGAKVVALASCSTPSALVELLTAGAFAVIGRGGDLAAAVASVSNGERYVAPDLLSTVFDPKVRVSRTPRFDLTHREQEVLAELVTGRSNVEISERLLIGTQTVKTHLSNIYDKLGVHHRTHAVRVAISHVLV